MKKVLAIGMPIIIIIGGMVLLYLFVLVDILDPPPNKVMQQCVDHAQEFVNAHTEPNETKFMEFFSVRTREGLTREWAALNLEGSRRGSWFELANGLLNDDGSRPEVIGVVEGPPPPEGEEEAAEEEGEPTEAYVRIRHNRIEHDIKFVRDEGRWRIEIPIHPTPWLSAPPAEGG